VAAPICTHLDQIQPVVPSGNGCVECLKTGQEWVHLRLCMTCGHVGCCDQSVGRHATKHHHATGHPIIQSFEPDEDWFYCYPDDLMFEIEGVPVLSYH
jgi:uncharacterized UBP type Zn finger protein